MERIDPQSWKDRINEFKEKTDAFYAGDMRNLKRLLHLQASLQH